MIEVKNLTKRYGEHTAVSNLSFTIPDGQIYGFLGPNGAGKSTTMNIMTGCLAPTEGQVLIGGHDILEEPKAAKRLIGYLPEQPPLYFDRTPAEYLRFVAEAKGIPVRQIPEQIASVMEKTQITQVADRLIRHLSKGYRQRVGIAQALLGDPEIIILDEPTVGLDPLQIIEIRDLIRSLGENHTVILSSHILSEVQAICQTILIINQGKLVACDTPQNLQRLFIPHPDVELTAEGTAAALTKLIDALPFPKKAEILWERDGCCGIHVEAEKPDLQRTLFWTFARANHAILQMTSVKTSLEDIFLELTQQPDKEGQK